MPTLDKAPWNLLHVFVVLCVCATPAVALENGLARTPPMGWNSWNKFLCKDLNEKVVRDAADSMIATGMQNAGYQYIVIDDCWAKARDASGNIVPDAETFPSGIKALADYVHKRGLKFGIYTAAGATTCAHRPGSLGHEYQDARQYAEWGVDYLKEDWCNGLPGQGVEASYTLMRDAIAATGRPIVFSLCEGGVNRPWLWAQSVGNLWRTTTDIQDCWSCKRSWGGAGVVLILDIVNDLYSYAGPGHWNDPDMLEIGNGGLSETESRAHFSLWAIMAAPLLAGNDLTKMSAETLSILTNKEVIAVDQDQLGIQGHRVRKDGNAEVWSKQLADGGRAVALLNRSETAEKITVQWRDIGYPARLNAKVRDLWNHSESGQHTDGYTAEVSPHGVVMLTVQPQ